MSRRHFDSTDNAELRAKIDKAKHLLPMPDLMRQLGYEEKHIGKTALCPFHDDHHPSFSVFKGRDGFWYYKCFVCDLQGGDEIAFLVKHFRISRREAIKRYLKLAGFPPRRSSESREYRKSSECSECSEYAVSSVSSVSSNGQRLQAELRTLAARNRCTEASTAGFRQVAAEKRFEVDCGLRAVEQRIGRKLTNAELTLAFDEWYRLSQPVLDPAETRDHHLLSGLAELRKVRVPAGREAITQAIDVVLKLPVSDLPVIPGMPNAPESVRRIAALHRELSRRSTEKDKRYFLGCRDAA